MRGLPRIEPAADFQAEAVDEDRCLGEPAGLRCGGWPWALRGATGGSLATSLAAFAVALVGGLYVMNGVMGPSGTSWPIADRRPAIRDRTRASG